MTLVSLESLYSVFSMFPMRSEYPVTFPLRLMQSTASHWRVMLVVVSSSTVTAVGVADGTRGVVKIVK